MKHCLPLPTGLSLFACMFLLNPVFAGPEQFNSAGFRSSHYRSPTPVQSEHARTLDTTALQHLQIKQPASVLIDVYNRQWLHGQFIEDENHTNLPGSIWLANTGLGELDSRWQRYFEDNLTRISNGNKEWPLVFYCRSDCWLGWNAVKRAHLLGYSNLYWYRDGIDAWEQAGLLLIPAHPEPVTTAHGTTSTAASMP